MLHDGERSKFQLKAKDKGRSESPDSESGRALDADTAEVSDDIIPPFTCSSQSLRDEMFLHISLGVLERCRKATLPDAAKYIDEGGSPTNSVFRILSTFVDLPVDLATLEDKGRVSLVSPIIFLVDTRIELMVSLLGPYGNSCRS
jgi:hypothetical protein